MRVPRTFVFVDLSGFTNYTAAFGDDAAGRILSTFRAIVREVASERGVRIAKWLGDGCMVVGDRADRRRSTFTLDLERACRRRVRPAHAAGRHRQRARAAVRGRRLHRLGRQHGRPAVRRTPSNYEVLMPTMHLDRLPEGVTAVPYGEIELRGFPGADRRRAPHGRPRLGTDQRHRRALDAQPVRLTGHEWTTVERAATPGEDRRRRTRCGGSAPAPPVRC